MSGCAFMYLTAAYIISNFLIDFFEVLSVFFKKSMHTFDCFRQTCFCKFFDFIIESNPETHLLQHPPYLAIALVNELISVWPASS